MENECYFITERGMVQDIKLKILTDSDITNVIKSIQENDIIFCKTEYLSTLSRLIYHIKKPFTLISGRSDYVVPDTFIQASGQLLKYPFLKKWYAINCVRDHEKFIPIPLGIDYHTIMSDRQITPIEQEKVLLDVKKQLKSLDETLPLAVTNFQHAMNDPPMRVFFRKPAFEILQKKDCVIWLPKQERTNFWKSCNDNMFVICPFGNGPDTHRTYEVLALGRVPIIFHAHFNENVYKNMPVVVVQDWNVITKEFLEDQYNQIIKKFKNNEYNYERITCKFWKDLITA